MVLLNISEVCSFMKMSRATVYRLMQSTNFPRPNPIAAKIRRWKKDEIELWIDQQVK
jgi:predicted DNA-binding transcriptional regulator AlpA